MQVTATTIDGVLRLDVSGKIDSTSTTALEATILRHVDGGAHRVVLDMSGVDYVSSSGLRALILGAKAAKRHGGKLVLTSLQDAVRRVLEVSGLTEVLTITADVDEARRALDS